MVGIAYFKKGSKAVVIAGKKGCCQIRKVSVLLRGL